MIRVRGSLMMKGIRPLVLTSLVLVGLLLPVVGAQASTPPTVPNPPQHWSFSAQKWFIWSGNRSDDGFQSTINLTSSLSAQYNITATNTSKTTTQLEGARSLLAQFRLVVCSPNCSMPQFREVVSLQGASHAVQFLNLTTAASVYENGSAVSALGILNISARSLQTLSEQANFTAGNRSVSQSQNFSRQSSLAIQFTPALGLIPWTLSANATWNSTSAFSAIGSWNDTSSSSGTFRSWDHETGWNSSGSVNRSGNESVRGRDLGNVTLPMNVSATAIDLDFQGPFEFDNGLFASAIGSDLFGGATSGWIVIGDEWERFDRSALVGFWQERMHGGGDGEGGDQGAGRSDGSAVGGSSPSQSSDPAAPVPTSTSPSAAPLSTGAPPNALPTLPPTSARTSGNSHGAAGMFPFALVLLIGTGAGSVSLAALWKRRRGLPP